jgi:predicted RNase H-like nuclease
MRYVGVDGCRAGWIAVFRKRGQLAYAILPSIRALIQSFPKAARICIDVPIGLPWRECPVRPCDRLARLALGADRRSSVFPVPCRTAVHCRTAREARQANQAELTRSLSAQAWGIVGKVAEVDAFLVANAGERSPLREAHPELCFWGLAGGAPMAHSKKTAAGVQERLRVISRHAPDATRLLERVVRDHPRKAVCPDDVLDALILFLTASAPAHAIRRMTDTPRIDQLGLPMEMLYARPYETRRSAPLCAPAEESRLRET